MQGKFPVHIIMLVAHWLIIDDSDMRKNINYADK